MLNKHYKYLPWLILGAIGSYQSAAYYARTAFDVFYLTIDTKPSLLTC